MRRLRRFNSQFEMKDKIILRDFLAMERTTLANERTFFAYVRTALYLILAGIAFVKLENFQPMRWVGYVLFGISTALIVFGIIRYQILQKKIDRFYDGAEDEAEKIIRKDKSQESEDLPLSKK